MSKPLGSVRYEAVRKLVNSDDWDFIGVYPDLATRDEYDCLAAPVMRLLEDGADAPAIRSRLLEEATGHFGTRIDPAQATTMAEQAVALRASWPPES